MLLGIYNCARSSIGKLLAFICHLLVVCFSVKITGYLRWKHISPSHTHAQACVLVCLQLYSMGMNVMGS